MFRFYLQIRTPKGDGNHFLVLLLNHLLQNLQIRTPKGDGNKQNAIPRQSKQHIYRYELRKETETIIFLFLQFLHKIYRYELRKETETLILLLPVAFIFPFIDTNSERRRKRPVIYQCRCYTNLQIRTPKGDGNYRFVFVHE